jgi:hypothetical protein
MSVTSPKSGMQSIKDWHDFSCNIAIKDRIGLRLKHTRKKKGLTAAIPEMIGHQPQ